MTTGDSVWDRGPDAGPDQVDDDQRTIGGDDEVLIGLEDDPGVALPDSDAVKTDVSREAISAESSDGGGDVWSRGPSPEEILTAAAESPAPPPEPGPVLPQANPPRSSRRRRVRNVRRPSRTAVLVTIALLGVGIAVSMTVLRGDDSEPVLAEEDPVSSAPIGADSARSVPESSIAPVTAVAAATTLVPASTAAPTTSEAPVSTEVPSAVETSAVETSIATTTMAPTTTAAPPDVGAPQVLIVGSEEPCKFGSDCLVADFTIANFDGRPHQFVCEFGSGERYTFRFGGDGAEDACATSSPTGTIVIEVDGVRSATLTR